MRKKRPSLEEVLRRRGQLIERAQMQRERIAENLVGLRGVVSWIDRGLEVAAYLRTHPLALTAAGAMALLVLRRPLMRGGLFRIIRRGFAAWRTILMVRSVALKLAR